MPAAIKYHYAIDNTGNIVDIASVSAHNKNCKFYCISCGGEMRPHLGNINAHHFAHKADTLHCTPESYLHKLAKRRIKEKFYSDNPFEISYSQETICSNKTTCPFYRKDECCSIMHRKYDLKHHYDTCDEEQPIGDFVADLLISSQNRPEVPPILIEIQVSHECCQYYKEDFVRKQDVDAAIKATAIIIAK